MPRRSIRHTNPFIRRRFSSFPLHHHRQNVFHTPELLAAPANTPPIFTIITIYRSRASKSCKSWLAFGSFSDPLFWTPWIKNGAANNPSLVPCDNKSRHTNPHIHTYSPYPPQQRILSTTTIDGLKDYSITHQPATTYIKHITSLTKYINITITTPKPPFLSLLIPLKGTGFTK